MKRVIRRIRIILNHSLNQRSSLSRACISEGRKKRRRKGWGSKTELAYRKKEAKSSSSSSIVERRNRNKKAKRSDTSSLSLAREVKNSLGWGKKKSGAKDMEEGSMSCCYTALHRSPLSLSLSLEVATFVIILVIRVIRIIPVIPVCNALHAGSERASDDRRRPCQRILTFARESRERERERERERRKVARQVCMWRDSIRICSGAESGEFGRCIINGLYAASTCTGAVMRDFRSCCCCI